MAEILKTTYAQRSGDKIVWDIAELNAVANVLFEIDRKGRDSAEAIALEIQRDVSSEFTKCDWEHRSGYRASFSYGVDYVMVSVTVQTSLITSWLRMLKP